MIRATVNKVQCFNLRERTVSLKTGRVLRPADGLIYIRCHFCLAQIGETKSFCLIFLDLQC